MESFRMPKFVQKKNSGVRERTKSFFASSKRVSDEVGGHNDKSYFQKTTSGSDWTTKDTLHEAAAQGDDCYVEELLDDGLDPNCEDDEGWTPLHHAANGGHTHVVKSLVAHGANINHINLDGDSPLHKAACWDHPGVVEALTQAGADINAQNELGWTPLHEAACSGRVSVVQRLLHLGANPNATTKDGDTALHKAARWGRNEVVYCLLCVGADPSVVDKHGRRAIDRTNEPGIMQMLLEAQFRRMPADGSTHGQPAAPGSASNASGCGDSRYSSSNNSSKPSSRGTSSDGSGAADGVPAGATFRTGATKAADALKEQIAVAEKRENYEVRWLLFATGTSPISYADVPFPDPDEHDPKALSTILLFGATTPEEKYKRLRAELLRWHPDKFTSLFGARLKAEDKQRIMADVVEMSQNLNHLIAIYR